MSQRLQFEACQPVYHGKKGTEGLIFNQLKTNWRHPSIEPLGLCEMPPPKCGSDPCGCQAKILFDLCKCYEDNYFWNTKEIGKCTFKAKQDKEKCIMNCSSTDDYCDECKPK